jgi:hypothetical protein
MTVRILQGDCRDVLRTLPDDAPFMRAAYGILVLQADGWDQSFGVAEEIKVFKAANKPVRLLPPKDLSNATVLQRLRDHITRGGAG